MTRHVEKVMVFMETSHELDVWLKDISDKISRFSPVSEDSDKAKSQLAITKVE